MVALVLLMAYLFAVEVVVLAELEAMAEVVLLAELVEQVKNLL